MLKSLQIGRALAAIAVVAFHLSITFKDPRFDSAPVFAWLTDHGSLGVDFFFVLSGFIILFVHHADINQPERVDSYLRKRVIRVYPMYLLLTVITIAGTVVSGGVKVLPSTPMDLASTIILVHVNSFTPPIGPAWTLYHEILFYAFFALLILKRWVGATMMVAWLVLILSRFTYSAHGSWSFWNTLSSASNLSFFCGMTAFALAKYFRGFGALTSVLAGIAVLASVYMTEGTFGSSTAFQVCYSVAFMLIIAGMVGVERSGVALSFPPLSLIGDASYTLYLAHESLESTLLKVALRLHLLEAVDHRVLYIMILAITIAISVLIHLIIEVPLLARLRGWAGMTASKKASAKIPYHNSNPL